MALRVRELTADEATTIKRVAHARTEPARRVERAQIVWLAAAGKRAPAIAGEVGVCIATVRFWLKRFNARGIAGLDDAPRPGPTPTYTPEQVGVLVATVLTNPVDLGLPFATWTLDRLVAYLAEHYGVAMKRSRADEILVAEGIRWRTQETWFGERVDPDFARKRGRSSSSIRSRQPAVS
jgi:transposase